MAPESVCKWDGISIFYSDSEEKIAELGQPLDSEALSAGAEGGKVVAGSWRENWAPRGLWEASRPWGSCMALRGEQTVPRSPPEEPGPDFRTLVASGWRAVIKVECQAPAQTR